MARKCSNCGQTGHNSRTCGKFTSINTSNKKKKKRTPSQRNCSICGALGHNKRTCLERTELRGKDSLEARKRDDEIVKKRNMYDLIDRISARKENKVITQVEFDNDSWYEIQMLSEKTIRLLYDAVLKDRQGITHSLREEMYRRKYGSQA